MPAATESSIAYLNGRFQLLERTSVPVQDRGFLFGDGVYEVVPVYDGRPFQLAAHLKRLRKSLQAVGISNPMSEIQWLQVICDLVEQNGDGDMSVYIQVTRGVAPRNHAYPADSNPTVFMMPQALPEDPAFDWQAGLSAMTTEDFRWQRCDIKSISLMANVMLRQMAVEQGADAMILLRDGFVTEGAASSVFVVMSGEVVTPPLSGKLLPGITRKMVIDLCRKEGIPLREAPVSLKSLQQADEVWLTGSTLGVMPVVMLDGHPLKDGEPGAIWQRVDQLYRTRTGQRARHYNGQHELPLDSATAEAG